MNDSSYCTGCHTLDYIDSYGTEARCSDVKYNSKGECPCSHCIVKCMCYTGCPQFGIFETRILDLKVVDSEWRGLSND